MLDPMVLLQAGVPLTLLMDLLDVDGPDSYGIYLAEPVPEHERELLALSR